MYFGQKCRVLDITYRVNYFLEKDYLINEYSVQWKMGNQKSIYTSEEIDNFLVGIRWQLKFS